MQKWEYIEVSLLYGTAHGTSEGEKAWFPRRINGKDVLTEKGWKEAAKVDGIQFINQLGEEGWELVSGSNPYPHNIPDDFILLFKRPKL